MKTRFYKYQATGNDFIIIDQFYHKPVDPADGKRIHKLCDRKFGIGADGLILLEPHSSTSFRMRYFNSDGNPGSFCGNGSRCAVDAMRMLGRAERECSFVAEDGIHSARILQPGKIEVHMQDVHSVEKGDGFIIMNTGSPHYVTFVEDLTDIDVVDNGRAIRYSSRFTEEGINVNFVQIKKDAIEVATYERGVENETLSCGTGVTASALASCLKFNQVEKQVSVITKGGKLKVRFHRNGQRFENIWLCGPAELVFSGETHL